MTIGFELESLDYRPDFEPQLTDLIHAVRFVLLLTVNPQSN